jgi:hypothetical protein
MDNKIISSSVSISKDFEEVVLRLSILHSAEEKLDNSKYLSSIKKFISIEHMKHASARTKNIISRDLKRLLKCYVDAKQITFLRENPAGFEKLRMTLPHDNFIRKRMDYLLEIFCCIPECVELKVVQKVHNIKGQLVLIFNSDNLKTFLSYYKVENDDELEEFMIKNIDLAAMRPLIQEYWPKYLPKLMYMAGQSYEIKGTAPVVTARSAL